MGLNSRDTREEIDGGMRNGGVTQRWGRKVVQMSKLEMTTVPIIWTM